MHPNLVFMHSKIIYLSSHVLLQIPITGLRGEVLVIEYNNSFTHLHSKLGPRAPKQMWLGTHAPKACHASWVQT